MQKWCKSFGSVDISNTLRTFPYGNGAYTLYITPRRETIYIRVKVLYVNPFLIYLITDTRPSRSAGWWVNLCKWSMQRKRKIPLISLIISSSYFLPPHQRSGHILDLLHVVTNVRSQDHAYGLNSSIITRLFLGGVKMNFLIKQKILLTILGRNERRNVL